MSEQTGKDPRARILRAPDAANAGLKPLFADARLVRRGIVRQTQEVQQTLQKALDEADAIVMRAEREADALRQNAVEQGRDEGVRTFVEEVSAARRARADARADAERDMLELAFGLAERLVARELRRDATAYEDLVESCLRDVQGERHVVVRVHPDVAVAFESGRLSIQAAGDIGTIQFEADSSLQPEDCVIETARGQVDGRLEVRLEALRNALQGGRDER